MLIYAKSIQIVCEIGKNNEKKEKKCLKLMTLIHSKP